MFSAIVIVGSELREEETESFLIEKGSALLNAPIPTKQATPLACVDVLGRCVLERLIDDLKRADASAISVLGDICIASRFDESDAYVKVEPCSADEAWQGVTQQLMSNRKGAAVTLLVRLGAYAELDLRDALAFHQEQGRAVTRAYEVEKDSGKQRALDVWIIDPASVTSKEDIPAILGAPESSRYLATGYVNRLDDPKDIRRLAIDGLSSRCRLRPQGTEIRPGVWVDEGAEIDRGARIVAPAYIGRRAQVAEQCLITRCSTIESDCQIDYGTVVEDSSILSNSYVGIGLDLAHSIVDGDSLLNLERGVMLTIADPDVIRPNRISRQATNWQSAVNFNVAGAPIAPVEEGSR